MSPPPMPPAPIPARLIRSLGATKRAAPSAAPEAAARNVLRDGPGALGSFSDAILMEILRRLSYACALARQPSRQKLVDDLLATSPGFSWRKRASARLIAGDR